MAGAAFADMANLPLVAPGQLMGKVTTPWGASVAVRAPHAPSVIGWPGISLPAQLDVPALVRGLESRAQRSRGPAR